MLVAQDGPLTDQRWPLARTVVLGRDSTCDIVIPDRQVSRYHARITPTQEGMILEDLGSKNGTHCNGTVLTAPLVLQDGDMVQIALAQKFQYLTSDATMPLSDVAGRPGRLMVDARSRRVWINQHQPTATCPAAFGSTVQTPVAAVRKPGAGDQPSGPDLSGMGRGTIGRSLRPGAGRSHPPPARPAGVPRPDASIHNHRARAWRALGQSACVNRSQRSLRPLGSMVFYV